MELPTTSVYNEECNDDDPDDERNIIGDPNLQLLQDCNDHFIKVIGNEEENPLITSQQEIQNYYIHKLYKILLNIRKNKNVTMKLQIYRNFDKYLTKLQEEPFFQN